MNGKKKIWGNNLQGNEIFMYFGFDFENEIKHETTMLMSKFSTQRNENPAVEQVMKPMGVPSGN